MADIDKETQAMGAIAGIVDALEEEQRGRVMRYILDRFNITGTQVKARQPAGTDAPNPRSENTTQFEDFASLVDACHPTTDSMRALAAGYWLQVCQGGQGFDGQSANTELKHLGHPIGNITNAIAALINQKPAFVLQLRKSGTTKQARKLYKVTEAGIRKIKTMMAGEGDAE